MKLLFEGHKNTKKINYAFEEFSNALILNGGRTFFTFTLTLVWDLNAEKWLPKLYINTCTEGRQTIRLNTFFWIFSC